MIFLILNKTFKQNFIYKKKLDVYMFTDCFLSYFIIYYEINPRNYKKVFKIYFKNSWNLAINKIYSIFLT